MDIVHNYYKKLIFPAQEAAQRYTTQGYYSGSTVLSRTQDLPNFLLSISKDLACVIFIEWPLHLQASNLYCRQDEGRVPFAPQFPLPYLPAQESKSFLTNHPADFPKDMSHSSVRCSGELGERAELSGVGAAS